MKLKTDVAIPASKEKIDHQSTVLSFGSCFSENMGQKLLDHKFKVNVNPFGILFNPAAIASALHRLIDEHSFSQNDFFQHNELWHSFEHHGAFSNPDLALGLAKINEAISGGIETVNKADVLIVTFGTASVYRHKKSEKIVANCHKVPQQEFEAALLSPDEIVAAWSALIKVLKSKVPELRIVFTVSPVRHWKDGAVGSQRSKAHLLTAVHKLVDDFDHCSYFPSYEIMMDELRDYRFYDEDLLHPNNTAIEIIWERFSATFFTDETMALNKELYSLRKAVQHRSINNVSSQIHSFASKHLEKIDRLKTQRSYLDLSRETAHFLQLLDDVKQA